MGLPKGRPFLLAINLAASDSPGLASLADLSAACGKEGIKN
jgi:hypothetical protein